MKTELITVSCNLRGMPKLLHSTVCACLLFHVIITLYNQIKTLQLFCIFLFLLVFMKLQYKMSTRMHTHTFSLKFSRICRRRKGLKRSAAFRNAWIHSSQNWLLTANRTDIWKPQDWSASCVHVSAF